MSNEKSRESRLRRTLAKQGFALRKTPARSQARDIHGVGYMIVDPRLNAVMSGGTPFPYSDNLDDVEAFLQEKTV